MQHDYQVIMTSNATNLDGTDHLLLLKKKAPLSDDVNV